MNTLEREVTEFMIVDLHAQPAGARIERWTARNSPTHEHIADLETQVIVQSRRSMTLDDEPALLLVTQSRANHRVAAYNTAR